MDCSCMFVSIKTSNWPLRPKCKTYADLPILKIFWHRMRICTPEKLEQLNGQLATWEEILIGA